jgi:hypothetical protein
MRANIFDLRRLARVVFAVTFFHAISIVCGQLFPIHASYFYPRVSGIIMFSLAVMIAFTDGLRTPADRRIVIGRTVCKKHA